MRIVGIRLVSSSKRYPDLLSPIVLTLM
jgi:hypothetical protein